jgi:hypothetical protein
MMKTCRSENRVTLRRPETTRDERRLVDGLIHHHHGDEMRCLRELPIAFN